MLMATADFTSTSHQAGKDARTSLFGGSSSSRRKKKKACGEEMGVGQKDEGSRRTKAKVGRLTQENLRIHTQRNQPQQHLLIQQHLQGQHEFVCDPLAGEGEGVEGECGLRHQHSEVQGQQCVLRNDPRLQQQEQQQQKCTDSIAPRRQGGSRRKKKSKDTTKKSKPGATCILSSEHQGGVRKCVTELNKSNTSTLGVSVDNNITSRENEKNSGEQKELNYFEVEGFRREFEAFIPKRQPSNRKLEISELSKHTYLEPVHEENDQHETVRFTVGQDESKESLLNTPTDTLSSKGTSSRKNKAFLASTNSATESDLTLLKNTFTSGGTAQQEGCSIQRQASSSGSGLTSGSSKKKKVPTATLR